MLLDAVKCARASVGRDLRSRILPTWSSAMYASSSVTLRAGQRPQYSASHLSEGSSAKRKATVSTLRALYRRREPITMTTAYDFPSALVADDTDIVLVGDSLSMVALGNGDTTQVDLEDMIRHCRPVTRGIKTSFTVCDLPMGSYETSPAQALGSAFRLIKEGQAQGVKLEGGEEMAPTISKIVKAGIPVLGHVGLMPQRHNTLGGFKTQGKTCDSAMDILRDALAVQDAGCFAVVLEAVPGDISAVITERLSIPTIGVGAGPECSGQGLVQADVVGQLPPGDSVPRFAKRYGDVWTEAKRALRTYRNEVKTGNFPAQEHVYTVSADVTKAFRHGVCGS